MTANYTGAEIELLVRAATSQAFNRLPPDEMKVSNTKVFKKDFVHAAEFVIKPVRISFTLWKSK